MKADSVRPILILFHFAALTIVNRTCKYQPKQIAYKGFFLGRNSLLWYLGTCSQVVPIFTTHKPPKTTSRKILPVKFFINGAIFLKFETEHFHMFANKNWDWNLWIGAPLHPGGPFHLPRKSQILHLWLDFAEIWKK